MEKTIFFLSTQPFSPWAILATWLHVGAPQKRLGKINLVLVFNKTSPRAHTKSELDMLGVPGKLVKYIVHSSQRNFFFK
jgi:hypothetical protein